jgi:hypothetical protein
MIFYNNNGNKKFEISEIMILVICITILFILIKI